MSDRPIGDHALLSDCHGSALVARDGTVNWWATPRFDSPTIFAELLDADGGAFGLTPVAPWRSQRRYLDRTLVLETVFTTDEGAVRVVDALALGPDERGHDLGRAAPGVLLREVTGLRGTVELELRFAPRPEYGLVIPLMQPCDGGVIAYGGAAVLHLSGSFRPELDHGRCRARVRVDAGETVRLALSVGSSWRDPPMAWSEDEIGARLADTIEAWRSWSGMHQSYDGPWRELVLHSGLVLQGLTFQPTGAIVAAATTSLPEQVGGTRNWDYRYTWLRDASLTLDALWVAACPDEAGDFFEFVTRTSVARLRGGDDLQIMFGVGGEHDLTERTLPHLRGWRGSAPVRIGNDAWRQRQLDVYGELLWAAHRLRHQLDRLDPASRGFLADLADAAAARWEMPDQGIWEMRGPPRHHVYSKLMCWVALDRAIALAPMLGAADRVPGWERTRADLRDAICDRGYSDELGAFRQAFDEDALDASALMIPITGFLPGDDPRVLATLDAIERDLTDERGLVWRYRSDDGLPGDEGAFLLCTFWLAHALALAGHTVRAREIFETAIAYRNDLDLLAEEVDPVTGEQLGNFPQAFSHVGLIGAAWAIHCAEERHRRGRTAPR